MCESTGEISYSEANVDIVMPFESNGEISTIRMPIVVPCGEGQRLADKYSNGTYIYKVYPAMNGLEILS